MGAEVSVPPPPSSPPAKFTLSQPWCHVPRAYHHTWIETTYHASTAEMRSEVSTIPCIRCNASSQAWPSCAIQLNHTGHKCYQQACLMAACVPRYTSMSSCRPITAVSWQGALQLRRSPPSRLLQRTWWLPKPFTLLAASDPRHYASPHPLLLPQVTRPGEVDHLKTSDSWLTAFQCKSPTCPRGLGSLHLQDGEGSPEA